MTVRLHDGAIIIEGASPVEDAETLLEQLQAHPGVPVDCAGCASMHTAVLQVLMAAAATVKAGCGDDLVRRWSGLGEASGMRRRNEKTQRIYSE
jgi:tripartite-type tricarboxylate transporter receptor subunit TctC